MAYHCILSGNYNLIKQGLQHCKREAWKSIGQTNINTCRERRFVSLYKVVRILSTVFKILNTVEGHTFNTSIVTFYIVVLGIIVRC